MDHYELVMLTHALKKQYLMMIEENGEDLRQTGFYYRFPLSTEATFDEDIILLNNRSQEINLPEGKAPNSSYFLVDTEQENKIIGAVNIRYWLDEYHRNRGGHIGYYVCMNDRNKGFAKMILAKALSICRQMGMGNVLVTCEKGNVASESTILANGGVLESEVEQNGGILQRYWITL